MRPTRGQVGADRRTGWFDQSGAGLTDDRRGIAFPYAVRRVLLSSSGTATPRLRSRCARNLRPSSHALGWRVLSAPAPVGDASAPGKAHCTLVIGSAHDRSHVRRCSAPMMSATALSCDRHKSNMLGSDAQLAPIGCVVSWIACTFPAWPLMTMMLVRSWRSRPGYDRSSPVPARSLRATAALPAGEESARPNGSTPDPPPSGAPSRWPARRFSPPPFRPILVSHRGRCGPWSRGCQRQQRPGLRPASVASPPAVNSPDVIFVVPCDRLQSSALVRRASFRASTRPSASVRCRSVERIQVVA